MKKKMKILCLLLALTLSMNVTCVSFAANEVIKEDIELIGYTENEMLVKNAEIKLSTYTARQNSSVSRMIDINPLESGNMPSMRLQGEFYAFPDGAYKDSMIIGNFESPDNDIEVVQVRLSAVSKEKLPVLDITVKDGQAGDVARTYGSISTEEFSELYAEAVNNSNSYLQKNENDLRAYKDFLVNLALGKEFCKSVESEAVEAENVQLTSDPNELTTRALKSSLNDFSYTDLKDFIDELKKNNTISLSAYSLSQSFFTNTGFEHVKDSDQYVASKYTHDNGGGVYYTRITLADLINGRILENKEIYYQMQYSMGVMIEYVEGTNFARLYLDNYGLDFKDVHLKIDKLGPSTNNIFIWWEMSGSVTNSNLNVVTLIGLVPKLSIASTMWSALEIYRTGPFDGGVVYFGETITEQVNRWGKVIRGIAFDSDNVYMESEGQMMTIRGGYSASGTPTYAIDCKYTART